MGTCLIMSPELQEKLYLKYPTLFIDPRTSEAYLEYGIEVGDGWYGLLDQCYKFQLKFN